MSDTETLNGLPRERVGKGGARALRRDGRIPAVVYGGSETPMNVSLSSRELAREYHRPGFFARLYDLAVDGDSHKVLPRDVQTDPVTDKPIHVDFLRYVKGAKLAVNVAVRFDDQEICEGLKQGGVLNIVRHEVELLCPVDTIPDVLAISLVGLEIGDSVHIGQVQLPPGVAPTITDRDFTIATIAAPTIHVEEVEEEAVEEAEMAEGEEAAAEAAAEPAETEAEKEKEKDES
jgi:large subunit ribosomal protein L25